MAKQPSKAAQPAKNQPAGPTPRKSTDGASIDILNMLAAYPPEEQVFILNNVIKQIAIKRADTAAITANKADQAQTDLKQFLVYHPSAEKHVKDYETARNKQ